LIVYDVNGIKHTQLFNLNTDKWEQFNLADDPNYTKKVEFMKMDLINNMKETHDDLDITKSNWGRKIGMKASGNNTTK